ncbi:zinc ribbon domain-containing protein [Thermodesulfobacteriota bacterium]
MAKTQKKINARKFVTDFKSGKSDQELMFIHDLSEPNLKKLLDLLVAKNLLAREDIERRGQPQFVKSYEPTVALDRLDAQETFIAPVAHHREAVPQDEGSTCPQCGAAVTERALTCPECGHVLPGEDRWAQVGQKVSLLERIPARLLGLLIAVPIGITVFIFFFYFLFPAQEARVYKTIDAYRSQQNQLDDLKKRRNFMRAGNYVKSLVNRRVFSTVSDDFAVFTTGPGWSQLSDEERNEILAKVRRNLVKAEIEPDFEVIDEWGEVQATVSRSSIDMAGAAPGGDQTSVEEGWAEDPEPKEPPSRRESFGDLEDRLNRRAPHLERIKRNLPGAR